MTTKYCRECSASISEHDKFCHSCGNPTHQKETNTNQRETFAGKVIKCPSCGSSLSSFSGCCNSCGHEINSAEVPQALEKFIAELNKCDTKISEENNNVKNTGWHTWSGVKKFGWVILNIYTLCIPLFFKILKTNLTPAEQVKKSMIINYSFPSDRYNLIEALLFIKNQINYIHAADSLKYKYIWSTIWANKASEIYHKLQTLFIDDELAKQIIDDIVIKQRKIKNKFQRNYIIFAIIIIFIFYSLLKY